MSSSSSESDTASEDETTPPPSAPARTSAAPRSLADLLAEAKANQKADFGDAHAEAVKGLRGGPGKKKSKASKKKPQTKLKPKSRSRDEDLRVGRIVVIVSGSKAVGKVIRAPSAHKYIPWEDIGFGASKLDRGGIRIPAGSTASQIIAVLKKYLPTVFEYIALEGDVDEFPLFLLQKDNRSLHRVPKNQPTFADFDAVCSGSNVPWRRRVLWLGTKQDLTVYRDALLRPDADEGDPISGDDDDEAASDDDEAADSASESDEYVAKASTSKKRTRAEKPVTRLAKKAKTALPASYSKKREPSPISISDSDPEPVASGSGLGSAPSVPSKKASRYSLETGFPSPSKKASRFDKYFT